jgi:type IV fimbrial biogenesis protein FimT
MQVRIASTVQRGWTLIEAFAVLAIVAVLGTTAAPALDRVRNRTVIDGTASEVVADLQFARSEALARNEGLRVSFHALPAGSCMIVHTRAVADCACDASGLARCGNGATLVKSRFKAASDGVAVNANVGSMLFDPKFGTVTPTGSVTLSNASGQSVRHVVNILGRVRSCTPQGTVPGYPAC